MQPRSITLGLIAALSTALSLAACKEGGDKAAEGAAPAAGKNAAAAAAGPDYQAIDGMVDAARTGDDFTNILMACGKLEIEAAAAGNGELAKDATYRDHCRARPARARAKLALAESTPDKMSVHCLGAAMALESLIEDGIEKAEAEALLPQVNQACGM